MKSTLLINGEQVEDGDIVVLMAHPDPMSARHPMNTYAVIVYSEEMLAHHIIEVPVAVLRALMTPYDFADLAGAIRDRREALEALPGDFTGIVAAIWKAKGPRP